MNSKLSLVPRIFTETPHGVYEAIVTTTLASAVGVSDTSIVVASATSFVAGAMLKIDGEHLRIQTGYSSGTTIPVLRGKDGTATKAHPITANVVLELGSDLLGQSPQTATQWPNIVGREVVSYSTSGAIALPKAGEDQIAVLNATSTLTMTLAVPTADMDGTILYIVSNGKGAHTVDVSGGVGAGGSGMNLGTFNTTEQTGVALMAINSVWVLWANGIASSGTQLAGVVFN